LEYDLARANAIAPCESRRGNEINRTAWKICLDTGIGDPVQSGGGSGQSARERGDGCER
jgi:hypothetical protein